jgi:hypothetical protein
MACVCECECECNCNYGRGTFVSELIYDSKLKNVKDARLFYFMLKSITDIENVGLCV